MPRMICVSCRRDLKVYAIGVTLADMAYDPPTTMATFRTDLFRCPECGIEIAAGFGSGTHDPAGIQQELASASRVIQSFESRKAKDKYDKEVSHVNDTNTG